MSVGSSTGGPRDWQQFYGFNQTLPAIASGHTIMLVDANPNRYYLNFQSQISGNVALWAGLAQPPGFQGFVFTSLFAFWELFFNKHGGLVQQRWWGTTQSGSGNVLCLEGIWLPYVE